MSSAQEKTPTARESSRGKAAVTKGVTRQGMAVLARWPQAGYKETTVPSLPSISTPEPVNSVFDGIGAPCVQLGCANWASGSAKMSCYDRWFGSETYRKMPG